MILGREEIQQSMCPIVTEHNRNRLTSSQKTWGKCKTESPLYLKRHLTQGVYVHLYPFITIWLPWEALTPIISGSLQRQARNFQPVC